MGTVDSTPVSRRAFHAEPRKDLPGTQATHNRDGDGDGDHPRPPAHLPTCPRAAPSRGGPPRLGRASLSDTGVLRAARVTYAAALPRPSLPSLPSHPSVCRRSRLPSVAPAPVAPPPAPVAPGPAPASPPPYKWPIKKINLEKALPAGAGGAPVLPRRLAGQERDGAGRGRRDGPVPKAKRRRAPCSRALSLHPHLPARRCVDEDTYRGAATMDGDGGQRELHKLGDLDPRYAGGGCVHCVWTRGSVWTLEGAAGGPAPCACPKTARGATGRGSGGGDLSNYVRAYIATAAAGVGRGGRLAGRGSRRGGWALDRRPRCGDWTSALGGKLRGDECAGRRS